MMVFAVSAVLIRGPAATLAQTSFSYDLAGNLAAVSGVVGLPLPTFQLGPQHSSTGADGLLSVSAPVTGQGPFAYQWLFNSVAIPGATNDSFQLPNASTNNLGNYQLVVANSAGSVTSAVINVSFDSDRNGLPDAWEMAYFGHIGVDPNADADGDGISNYVEWLDGTNPTDAASLMPRLYLSGTAGGSVSVSPLQAKYDLNAAVQLIAQPDPGQSFMGWFGSTTSVSNPATLVMNGNKTVTGLFGLPLADSLDTTNVAWSAGGDLGWFGQSATTHDGVDAAQSGPIKASQQSWIETTIANSTRSVVRFWWRVSSYSGNDYARFYVNGGLVNSLTGESGWLFQTYYLPPGTNTLRWVYAKGLANGQYNPSQDAAWLDQVDVIPFENLYAWSDNSSSQSRVPPGLTNLVAIAGGGFHSLALRSDGTVAAWGDDSYGQSDIPAGLTNVVAIAGGGFHSLAVKRDGTVTAWGDGTQGATNVPSGLSNVVAISAGWEHSLALRTDGTVAAWGNNRWGAATAPQGLSNVVSVAAGWGYNLALKSDGTVVAWGYNGDHQTNVPSGLSGVVAISAGWDHCLALRSDGTVVAWGNNSDGQTSVPSGLGGVVAIAGGGYHSLALKANGTVAAWGDDSYGQVDVPSGLTSVVAIAAGGYHSLALVDGGPPVIARQPFCQTASAGTTVTLAVATIAQPPLSYQWRLNGTNIAGATNATLTLANVQAVNAGSYSVLVSNGHGNVASSTARLTITPAAPTIVAQPSNENVFFGDGAAFTVAARGTEPLAYQWQFNGANIDRATNATFAFTNVQPSDVGNYVVIVSNAVGHVASQVVALMGTPPPVCVPRPDGLVAWWPGDGFALDVVGTNHGTLQNGATYGPGMVGKAFNFNGSGAFISVANTATVDFGTGDFSIAVWIRLGSLAQDQEIIQKSVGTYPNEQAYFLEFDTPNALRFVLRDSSANQNDLSIPTQLTTGNWYLVAGVRSGNTNQLYLDGNLIGSQVSGSTANTGAGGIARIGRLAPNPSNIDRYFLGDMDELALYSRALSPDEIASVYAAGRAGICFTNDPAPVFVQQPASQTGYAGGMVTLSGAAMGSPRPTYQWRLNGNPLPGATNATLAIVEITPADAGVYTLVASSAAGVSESQPATLFIELCLARPAGMVAWWPLDVSFTEVVQGVTGVPAGGPTSVWDGKVGSAVRLNGDNQGIRVNSTGIFRGRNEGTIAGWVRPRGLHGDNVGAVWFEGTSLPGYTRFGLFLTNSGGVRVGGRDSESGSWKGPESRATAPLNVWTHVAGTWKAGEGIKVFLNGALDTVLSDPSLGGFTGTASAATCIGCSDGVGSASTFNGDLDEISLFSRALDPSEIASLCAAGSAGICFTNDPAPVFVQQPVSQTGYVGGAVTLSGAAMGTPRPTYQWRLNGNPLPGATNATLAIMNLTPADAGSYTVVASNSAGTTESWSAVLSVEPCLSRPSGLIAWWPGDGFALDVVGTNHATLLNGAGFSAGKASSGFNLDGSDDFISLGNGIGNCGASDFTIEFWLRTTSTRNEIIMGKRSSCDHGSFWNIFHSAGSLNVEWDQNSSGQNYVNFGTPKRINDGLFHHVGVVRNVTNALLYVDGHLAAQGSANGTTIISNSSPLYVANGPCVNGSGVFRFSGVLDEASIYTRALAAEEIAAIHAAGVAGKCFTNDPAPVFVQQPVSQTGYVGGAVTLSGAAMGTPRPTYQWRLNGNPLPGATNATLAIMNLTPADAGVYTLVASSTAGVSESQTATLAIEPCLARPAGMVAWWPGDGFAMDVAGTNQGTLQNGATFAPGRVGQAFSFDGTSGYVTTSDEISNPQNFTLELWFRTTTTQGGVLVGFGNVQRGGGETAYDRNLYMDDSGALIFGEVGPAPGYVISPASYNDGNWHCVAATSSTNAGISLYVDGSLVANNQNTTLGDNYSGWWRIGQNYLGGWSFSPSSFFFKGLIDEVGIFNRPLSSDEIASMCAVGRAGLCFTNDPAPVFVQQPVCQTGYVGGAVTLAGAAMGSPRPTSQWKFNGNPLSGATNSALTLTNLSLADSGVYTLVASNIVGVSESQPATLSVRGCFAWPAGMVAWWTGDGTTLDIAGTNNGVIQTGASYAAGMVGQAFYMDGAGGRVEVTPSSVLNLRAALTVQAWINPSASISNRDATILRNGLGYDLAYSLMCGTNFSLRFHWYDGAFQFVSSSPNAVRAGIWWHVAATRTDSQFIRLYVNGMEVASGQGTTPVSSVPAKLDIGSTRPMATFQDFCGFIDEVALFSRALSASEIAAIYSAGPAGICRTAAPPLAFDASPSSLGFTNGGFGLLLNGLSGRGPVVISASTNLLEWDSIFTNPAINGTLQFLDMSATNWPRRFYRAQER